MILAIAAAAAAAALASLSADAKATLTAPTASGLPITTLKPIASKTPQRPQTGRQAVALVRANPDTNRAASPFAHELGWVAQWRGDRWWVLGLFSSDSGTRFVVDASIESGKVYTYINYVSRPSLKWVRATAKRWNLNTLYTRLTPAAAVGLVQHVVSPTQYTILGSAAKLAVDTAQKVGWYFAFYVQRQSDSAKLVLVVDGLGGGDPVEEGNYTSGYGFGGQPSVETSVPLNLSDWVRTVAHTNGWTPSNLP